MPGKHGQTVFPLDRTYFASRTSAGHHREVHCSHRFHAPRSHSGMKFRSLRRRIRLGPRQIAVLRFSVNDVGYDTVVANWARYLEFADDGARPDQIKPRSGGRHRAQRIVQHHEVQPGVHRLHATKRGVERLHEPFWRRGRRHGYRIRQRRQVLAASRQQAQGGDGNQRRAKHTSLNRGQFTPVNPAPAQPQPRDELQPLPRIAFGSSPASLPVWTGSNRWLLRSWRSRPGCSCGAGSAHAGSNSIATRVAAVRRRPVRRPPA